MKDSILLKTALITSIVGVLGLFFLMQNYEMEETKFIDLELEEQSKIIGFVENVQNTGNVTIITISQVQTIKGVIFENISIPRNQEVEIIGEITEYNGKKEIIIEKIKII